MLQISFAKHGLASREAEEVDGEEFDLHSMRLHTLIRPCLVLIIIGDDLSADHINGFLSNQFCDKSSIAFCDYISELKRHGIPTLIFVPQIHYSTITGLIKGMNPAPKLLLKSNKDIISKALRENVKASLLQRISILKKKADALDPSDIMGKFHTTLKTGFIYLLMGESQFVIDQLHSAYCIIILHFNNLSQTAGLEIRNSGLKKIRWQLDFIALHVAALLIRGKLSADADSYIQSHITYLSPIFESCLFSVASWKLFIYANMAKIYSLNAVSLSMLSKSDHQLSISYLPSLMRGLTLKKPCAIKSQDYAQEAYYFYLASRNALALYGTHPLSGFRDCDLSFDCLLSSDVNYGNSNAMETLISSLSAYNRRGAIRSTLHIIRLISSQLLIDSKHEEAANLLLNLVQIYRPNIERHLVPVEDTDVDFNFNRTRSGGWPQLRVDLLLEILGIPQVHPLVRLNCLWECLGVDLITVYPNFEETNRKLLKECQIANFEAIVNVDYYSYALTCSVRFTQSSFEVGEPILINLIFISSMPIALHIIGITACLSNGLELDLKPPQDNSILNFLPGQILNFPVERYQFSKTVFHAVGFVKFTSIALKCVDPIQTVIFSHFTLPEDLLAAGFTKNMEYISPVDFNLDSLSANIVTMMPRVAIEASQINQCSQHHLSSTSPFVGNSCLRLAMRSKNSQYRPISCTLKFRVDSPVSRILCIHPRTGVQCLLQDLCLTFIIENMEHSQLDSVQPAELDHVIDVDIYFSTESRITAECHSMFTSLIYEDQNQPNPEMTLHSNYIKEDGGPCKEVFSSSCDSRLSKKVLISSDGFSKAECTCSLDFHLSPPLNSMNVDEVIVKSIPTEAALYCSHTKDIIVFEVTIYLSLAPWCHSTNIFALSLGSSQCTSHREIEPQRGFVMNSREKIVFQIQQEDFDPQNKFTSAFICKHGRSESDFAYIRHEIPVIERPVNRVIVIPDYGDDIISHDHQALLRDNPMHNIQFDHQLNLNVPEYSQRKEKARRTPKSTKRLVKIGRPLHMRWIVWNASDFPMSSLILKVDSGNDCVYMGPKLIPDIFIEPWSRTCVECTIVALKATTDLQLPRMTVRQEEISVTYETILRELYHTK